MTSYKTEPKRTTTWILIVLAGVAIAAAIYYYFDQMSGNRAASAPPPSTEWTTAPGGVEVELPQTPMTNAPPDAVPAQGAAPEAATADEQPQGEGETS
ncbi:MAG: hypothetical protein NXH71_09615 [Erythrobacteraceae bacterium]|jgi:hypothetical protein|nr:hypothetical protein [Erythrobacteraceae bacterium]